MGGTLTRSRVDEGLPRKGGRRKKKPLRRENDISVGSESWKPLRRKNDISVGSE